MTPKNNKVTQQQWEAFQRMFPNNPKIQAVSYQELLDNTNGGVCDWSRLPALRKGPRRPAGDVAQASVSDCELQLGFVLIDCIVLAVGALTIRAEMSPADALEVAEAGGPALSRMEQWIATICNPASSTTEIAEAVFNILSTVANAGCLGAVIDAWLGTLEWYDYLLYGTIAMATIVAVLATDGVAFVAMVVIELANFGFLVVDSINASSACSGEWDTVGKPEPSPFKPVPGSLVDVSVGSDGTVWGVNENDEILHWNGNSWTMIPGSLAQISVGSATLIWGVNTNDEIYRWNGKNWTKISGSLKNVSVASDGTVWGVNKNDEIYRWNGNSWTMISGSLSQISVGSATLVWGVNKNDEIYRWNGKNWTKISGSLKDVSVASDGTVWGVNSEDHIFRRDGDVWTQVPGLLSEISAGSATQVWGVNSDQMIFRYSPEIS